MNICIQRRESEFVVRFGILLGHFHARATLFWRREIEPLVVLKIVWIVQSVLFPLSAPDFGLLSPHGFPVDVVFVLGVLWRLVLRD